MYVTFANAPLVEIIAELRWNLPQAVLASSQKGTVAVPISIIGSSKVEEFFMRFGGVAYQLGFQRAERIVPPGFPVLPGQPVYRYKPTEASPDVLMRSALLQVGPGVFSANAIPPYKSWSEFAPIVASGVRALLETRDDAEKPLAFTGVSLRYIDAFGPSLLGGMAPAEFIDRMLGFSATLPVSLTAQLAAGAYPKAQLQITVPLKSGMTMNVAVGEGSFNNADAAIMDTTVSANGEVPADLDAVMATLNAARDVIHEAFVGMTQKIRDRMRPVGGA